MTKVNPSMRLKVNRDTFFIPDANRGMYFRNNTSSFRMEGNTIVQWIEKLIPMFNGQFSLKELTDGLPNSYKNRVLEIADVLLENGYVRDISQDHPHHLSEESLTKFASQIEFLDHFGGSGAYRFELFQQSKVLVIGSGTMIHSLVYSLVKTGLPNIHVLFTKTKQDNRLEELLNHINKTEFQVNYKEHMLDSKEEAVLRNTILPFESIFYVSEEGNINELRLLHKICREENKLFIPAIFINQYGMAGPIVTAETQMCWESAWRSIHKTALQKKKEVTLSTSITLLANVTAFEWFKKITGVNEETKGNPFYFLNCETLEGSWHSFLPHTLVTNKVMCKKVDNIKLMIEQKVEKSPTEKWFYYFTQLTSKTSGIFHIWEEEDLYQIPLAQCAVQVANPICDGPCELLPKMIVSELTHEEARKEAGLSGIEAYVSRLIENYNKADVLKCIDQQENIGVGAGETFSECILRGLQNYLHHEFRKEAVQQKYTVYPAQINSIHDEQSQFYLQAITTLQGKPIIALGENVLGFPVVWIGLKEGWYGSVGLNMTVAFRSALKQAIMLTQNKSISTSYLGIHVPNLKLEEKQAIIIEIPNCEMSDQSTVLQSSINTLETESKQLTVLELNIGSFENNQVIDLYGVIVREEETG